jgi:hypothetical protein
MLHEVTPDRTHCNPPFNAAGQNTTCPRQIFNQGRLRLPPTDIAGASTNLMPRNCPSQNLRPV